MKVTGTFSILAISSDLKFAGVAVASGSTHVGSRVPHARPGVGVIATQAYTNVIYGIKGLKLMANGLSPEEVLKKLLADDPRRELRQVAIMDFMGRKAVFTGTKAPQLSGELVGKNYIVIGNLLTGADVLNSMAKAFEISSGGLAWRMLRALEAGRESGGDKRGERSAALTVIGVDEVKVKLTVDVHESPISELRRILEEATLREASPR